jgi:hypothetical protein
MYQHTESSARSTIQGTEQAICQVDARAVWKVEHLSNRSRGHDVTSQPVGGDLTAHP